MYYLGLVLQNDVNDGYINAEYILCKSKGRSKNRSPYRVYRYGNGLFERQSRILVGVPHLHPELIDFLSNYRRRDHIHVLGKSIAITKKYRPVGSLFWFECDRYGTPTGKKIFIKNVPDKKYCRDDAMRKLYDAMKKKDVTLNYLLKDDSFFETKDAKIKLVQKINKKEGEHNG